MSKSIEEILESKPEARPRIYAYTIEDQARKGLLKIGQTTLGINDVQHFNGCQIRASRNVNLRRRNRISF